MKLVLLGYGKMGKAIEPIALERGHEIIHKINSSTNEEALSAQIAVADVVIEFSRPELAVQHIKICFEAGTPVVVGTTGWYDSYDEVVNYCEEKQGALLAATNFSIGVNLFFELNRQLAQLMSKFADYQAEIEEIHHTEKLDAPSGTAISLAEGIIGAHPAYENWQNEASSDKGSLAIISKRLPKVPGTHRIQYQSEIDQIEITHTAHNRKGFALGAVLAAEWIQGRKGVFSMSDLLANSL